MRKKILVIFTLFILLNITKSAVADLVISDESKTIRELTESIEGLDKIKNELYTKLKVFSLDQSLKTFFKDDLVLSDLENLKVIIEQYSKTKEILEKNLLDNSNKPEEITYIRIKLLEAKKELYKNMTPYIKMEFYTDYLDYIKSDSSIYSEKNEIDSSIYRKQEILNNKLTILEEKIKEHKTFLEDSLKSLVEGRMEEKLNFLSKNKSFSNLQNDEKIKILEKTILKVKNNIKNLNSDTESISLFIKVNNDKKIEIYNIVLDKLEFFRDTYK